jgi:hypothetical protein
MIILAALASRVFTPGLLRPVSALPASASQLQEPASRGGAGDAVLCETGAKCRVAKARPEPDFR